jgi:glyoxylase-like metal-dependent hydrolase (beta-lactamase superfamily II)
MTTTPDGTFAEVADRCWVARHEFLDVNVTVVGGDAGLVVVDTGWSSTRAERLVDAVRRLSAAPVLAAVNTHAHFDHSFGNAVFARDGVELVCHEGAAAELPAHAASIRDRAAAEPDEPEHADIAGTAPVVPARTFSSALALDLGGRQVELVHPGRGHTGGDLVVRVSDADVLLAGDLVEESAVRAAVPGFGPDCFPLEWPATLDLVLGLLGPASLVVPGHGAPVDQAFVQEQRSAIGVVAETIRDLAGRGVAPDDALAAAQWPYPVEELGDAVRRGYAQLPRGVRRLPLA